LALRKQRVPSLFEHCHILHLAGDEEAVDAFRRALADNAYSGRYKPLMTKEALETAANDFPNPDAIVVEDRFPGPDTSSVVRELSSRASFRESSIIVYSAVTDETAFQSALKAGATGYLIKSDDFDESVRRVRRILELCQRV